MIASKPRLTFSQIINMNFGFFGLQYSFGLQQNSMSPIYKYLGANEAELPYLWLAGPMTGLIVQPIIGAMSDKTITKWGRRTPYFLIGAVICSLGLFFMPYSKTLWMAASLLWILDVGNNITQEPYRAFVSDKLDKAQHSIGFLTQSAFTGLGQTLAYLTPSILIWTGMSESAKVNGHIPLTIFTAFIIGSVFSIGSILVSVLTTKEIPLTEDEIKRIKATPGGFLNTFKEIGDAFREMPLTMKQLAFMKLFQWYAMFCYWQYVTLCVSKTFFGTTDSSSPFFDKANYIYGQAGAFYNFIAFLSAFLLVRLANRFGPKTVHAVCLVLAGISMICIPLIHDKTTLFFPMIGVGLAWASIMGNPYIMLAGSIPPERTGVYMGIFNMFIVIPMMIQIFTLPLYYDSLLNSNPQNVIRLAGALLICAAIAVMFVKVQDTKGDVIIPAGGGH
jgi:maltose/moltooligosaccharide transporter